MQRFLPLAISLFLIVGPLYVECGSHVTFVNSITDNGGGCLTTAQRIDAAWLVDKNKNSRALMAAKDAKDAGASAVDTSNHIANPYLSSFSCGGTTVVGIKVHDSPTVVLDADNEVYSMRS